MITTNFHTHTLFCDGKNTPQEMVEAALNKGFSALGFSCHSYLDCAKDWTVSPEKQEEYISEINRLKNLNNSKIEIFCGIEQDYFSDPQDSRYEYSIGSVHFVQKNDTLISLDTSIDSFEDALNKYYGGDYDELAKDYFALVGDVINKTDADIIGHFDLITKYNEKLQRTPSKKFFDYAKLAVGKLIPYGRPFEINTGAIARGYRTVPYPSPEILKMIKDMGGKIIFSSDCHNKDFLDCYYREAENLAKQIGFSTHCILTKDGIKEIPL